MTKAGMATDSIDLSQTASISSIDTGAIPASVSTVYLSPSTVVNDGAFQEDSHVASIIFTTESGSNGLKTNSFKNVGNVTFYVRKGTSAWDNVQSMATAQGLGTIDYGKSFMGLMGAGNVTIKDLDIEGDYNGWIYEYINKTDHSHGLRILGYNGTLSGNVTIPSSLPVDGDVAVVEIGSGALKGQSVGGLTIPDSVKKIGASAFEDCGSLAEVKIGAADLIDMSAFKGCSKLGKVTIDGSALSTNSGKVTQYLSIFDDCKDDLAFKVQTNTNAYSFLKEYVDKHNILYGTHYTISKSTYVLKSGSDFNKLIPSNATAVKFCYDTAPSGAAIIDVDADGDGGVVAWMEGTTMKVSTQESGTKVKANNDCGFMFYLKKALTGINLTALDTSMATDMSYMFNSCGSLESLNVFGFNTSMVTSMRSMFGSCSNLKTLDISNFNTASVTNISGMFMSCGALSALNLTNFNTSVVKDMSFMFSGCASLATLNASAFNTSNVINMMYMFSACRRCTLLDLSSFDTARVTNMVGMFGGCSSLTSLDVTNFNTANVTNMGNMFNQCPNLNTFKVGDKFSFKGADYSFPGTKWYSSGGTAYSVTGGVVNFPANKADTYTTTSPKPITYALKSGSDFNKLIPAAATAVKFCYDKAPSGAVIINVDADSDDGVVAWMEGTTMKISTQKSGVKVKAHPICAKMFYNKSNLISIDLTALDASNITSMDQMFYNCKRLTNLDVSSLDTSNVTNMHGMFDKCISLTSLDLSNFDTSKVTNMAYMFSGCTALKYLNIASFKTINVAVMSYMFSHCESLTSLNLSNFNTTKVTNMCYMFSYCKSLTSLNISSFNTIIVTDMSAMFAECSRLQSLSIPSTFTTNCVNTMRSMFNTCTLLRSLDLHSFRTETVEDMSYMFSGCRNLAYLNVLTFVTTKCTNMDYMFANCAKLDTLDIRGFRTSSTTSMTYAFDGCSVLTTLRVGSRFGLYGGGYRFPGKTWKNSAGARYQVTTGIVNFPNNKADTYTKIA